MPAFGDASVDRQMVNADEGLNATNTCFSSEDWNPHDRIDAIQQVMSPLFNVAPLDRQAHLSAYMNISMLKGMVFSETEFFNHQCLRDPIRASVANFDSLLIQFFNQGSISGEIDGECFEVRQGGVVVFDLCKAYEFQSTTSKINKCLNIVVPRFMLDAYGHGILHGKVLSPSSPITKLVASHMSALQSVLSDLDSSEFLAAQQMTVDILNSGFRLHMGINNSTEGSMKELICQYIFNNCQDALSIDSLAEKFHTSRSTLFRIFSAEGGVASYIKNIRLERCLRDVLFLGGAVSIGELALKWGFSSDQHLMRSFKSKFKHSPSQLRIMAKNGVYPLEINGLYEYISEKANMRVLRRKGTR